MKSINLKGQLIDLETPIIMGILNVTPDSFFDGGQHQHLDDVLAKASQMLQQGATIIDVGAYSSRPNGSDISVEEELMRLKEIVPQLTKHFSDAYFSIDTFRSQVADFALSHGFSMVNDISGFSIDETILNVVSEYKVPYVMMHMRGTPQTMQQLTQYDDLVKDIMYYFSEKISKARAIGLNDIIIDLGFGFAKTLEQNFELLSHLDLFKIFEVPILTGVSRKSMIYKTLDITPQEALNGTTTLNMYALKQGSNILRVHDVIEAKEVVDLYLQLKKYDA